MSDVIEYAYRLRGKDPQIRVTHRHGQACELLQILSADGTVLIGEKVYPFLPGTLYLIPADCLHSTRPVSPNSYVRSKVICSADYFMELLALSGAGTMLSVYRGGGGIVPLTPKSAEEIDSLFRSMCLSIESAPEGGQLIVSSALLNIAAAVSAEYAAQPAYEWRLTPLGGIIHYLNEHLEEKISTHELASRFFMSDGYLCRMFKARTGLTITQYVLEQRLARARSMLQFSGERVSAVADACGFESLAYFCKAFKKSEGLPPSAYRKSKRGDTG